MNPVDDSFDSEVGDQSEDVARGEELLDLGGAETRVSEGTSDPWVEHHRAHRVPVHRVVDRAVLDQRPEEPILEELLEPTIL